MLVENREFMFSIERNIDYRELICIILVGEDLNGETWPLRIHIEDRKLVWTAV